MFETIRALQASSALRNSAAVGKYIQLPNCRIFSRQMFFYPKITCSVPYTAVALARYRPNNQMQIIMPPHRKMPGSYSFPVFRTCVRGYVRTYVRDPKAQVKVLVPGRT